MSVLYIVSGLSADPNTLDITTIKLNVRTRVIGGIIHDKRYNIFCCMQNKTIILFLVSYSRYLILVILFSFSLHEHTRKYPNANTKLE